MTTTAMVSEVFGPTVQGEGPSCGRRAGFLRLGRCNLDCAWCDTPFTWDWWGKNGEAFDPAEQLTRFTVDEVLEAVDKLGVDLLVITGGEPLLQGKAVAAIVGPLITEGYRVEVETNGTRRPPIGCGAHFNVSPKLDNSGVDPELRYKPEAIDHLVATGRAIFKFVCVTPACLDEVNTLVEQHGIDRGDVWIMPEGRSAGAVNAHGLALADAAIAAGFNITGRLHVQLWGDERKR